MKVLVVKVSALGDVVHALPVLYHIKSTCPDAEIDWLVESPFAPLLEGHPLIRKVHRIDTRKWRKSGGITSGYKGLLSITRDLRREKYDLAMDLQGNTKSGVFMLLSGTPLRYGFDAASAREFPNLLATNHRVSLSTNDYHISDRSLKIAREAFPPAGSPIPSRVLEVQRHYTGGVEARLRNLGIRDRVLVVLHCGTTWKTKLWPVDLWQELAVSLERMDNVQLLLTWGNESELAMAKAIHRVTGSSIIWPRGSLGDLAAVLSRAHLVVGGDTGPIHIAAALGTPTVSIFRATHGLRNGPRGAAHICLQSSMDCSPCLLKNCPRDIPCGHSIGAGPVLEAVSSLLLPTKR